MGIFGAMLTAVTGLKAQGFALENISGNIANSRTTGFKRVDTSFVDLIPDAPLNREQAASVLANGRNTVQLQGDLTTTQVGTNMAINGDGLFVVQERTSYAGGDPVFGGVDLYTRRGDFEIDKDGYLVNGAGYYLKGVGMDPLTGALIGSKPDVIHISGDNLPAKSTTLVQYRANLPSYPRTNDADSSVPGSELLSASGFSVDPRTSGAGYVAASDVAAFIDQSVPAGAVTLYNQVGSPVNVQMRWAKTQNAAGGGDTWNLFYQESTTATGATPAWRNMGTDFTFDANGSLTSSSTLSLPSVTVNGATVGPVTMDFGTSGLSQFADANGQVQINSVQQDGYASGVLQGIKVGDGGRIVGSYSNGQVVGLAQVVIAQFNGDNQLKRRDGGTFEQTLESGAPILLQGGRNVVGSTLENSNSDISEEFSKMIVTQQAYSANTRVISTSQQMLQDVLNIIR
ncbi:MAG: flagellar hook-basal body complex protein [Proteobacteria bacterium]|nr:flagellar hook-basal body complex protein [Pseudomonadota bacterium]